MAEYLVSPKPAPDSNIPQSNSTVTVRVIDSTSTLQFDSDVPWNPRIKGLDPVKIPIYCFLISNGNRHVLFDLGIRRDWENLPPGIVSMIKSDYPVTVEKDMAEILDTDTTGVGIGSKDIEAIIWSHHHFDHIGDPTTFPTSTDLLVGPGFKKAYWPGYPTNPQGCLLDSVAEGRNFREIEFNTGLTVGRFDAIDYFGDGSFYLLNAPGHTTGHLCGLARVTTSPESFVLMGEDACHHVGVMRPTEYLPLPANISPSPIAKYAAGGCPGAALQQLQPNNRPNEAFLTLSPAAFPDFEAAQETLRKVEELDAAENIFVILAHDRSLEGQIDFYPETINDWMAKGYRAKTRWLFCKDFAGVVE
ncbi:hypothetical protein FQN50_001435 [Emmonsiellopsis sp. PD_5]|nr:hypothetical protein FQN50_001435 [Emmonsiellopsis sp. PD_5]